MTKDKNILDKLAEEVDKIGEGKEKKSHKKLADKAFSEEKKESSSPMEE
jgi:hypothetical protein